MTRIITFNHPTLRKRAKAVKSNDPDLNKIFRNMIGAMDVDQGIGLAAPQINISKRIVIIKTDDAPLILINPKITRKSLKKAEIEEGCLSIPGFFGLVKRSQKIKICWQDKSGHPQKMSADGLMARVFQHEIDHLNGQLFVYKVNKFTKGDQDELWKKMRS